MEDQRSDCPCKKQRVSDSEVENTGDDVNQADINTECKENAEPSVYIPPNFVPENEDREISMCSGGLLDCLTGNSEPSSDIPPNFVPENEDREISMCSGGLIDCLTGNAEPTSDIPPNFVPENEDREISMCSGGLLDCLTGNAEPTSDIPPNLKPENEDREISMCFGGLQDCLTEASGSNVNPSIDADTGEIESKSNVRTTLNRKPYPGQRVSHDIVSVVQDNMAALAENTYIRNKEASMLAVKCDSSLAKMGPASLPMNDLNVRSVRNQSRIPATAKSNFESFHSDVSGSDLCHLEHDRNEETIDNNINTCSQLGGNKDGSGAALHSLNEDVRTDLKDTAEPGTSFREITDTADDTNVIGDHGDDDIDYFIDDDDDNDDADGGCDDGPLLERHEFLSDSGFISLFSNCRNPTASHESQTDYSDRPKSDTNIAMYGAATGMSAAGDASTLGNNSAGGAIRGTDNTGAEQRTGNPSGITHSVSCSGSESSPFGELKIKSLFLDSFFKYIPCGSSGKHEVNCRPSNTLFQLDNEYIHGIMTQNNINSLPPQILVHIFRYLSTYTLLRKVSLVCKYWYNWCRDQDLWKIINLMNQHRLTDVHLQQLISFSDRVVSVNLTDCRFVTSIGVKMLLARCVHLQMLKLMRCFDLSDEAFKDICDRNLCSQLRCLRLDGCCKITDATIIKVAKACPHLQILHINQCTKITDVSIQVLADGCPNLTQLLMDHCSQVTEKGLEAIVEGCSYMTYLNIMSCGVTDRGVKLLSKLTNLTNVDLSNIPRLTPDAIMYLSRHCRNLECINISLNSVMNDQCVTELAKNLPKLKRLYCVSCNISDTGLKKIAEYRPTLEALDVGWCQDITDHGVCAISEACPHLDYFGLIRCDQVSIGKVEELVIRFPHVNYSTFVLESRRIIERAQREGFMFGQPVMKPGSDYNCI